MHQARAFFFVCAGLLAFALLLPRPAAAAWPTDPLVNVPLCDSLVPAGADWNPAIASDGAGGAIVAWQYGYGGGLYAQHVLASGVVDPAWPKCGRELCTPQGVENGQDPVIASDGAGGAIIAWDDFRTNQLGDVYAQHVLATGMLDPSWPAAGLVLANAPDGNGGDPCAIVSDGTGGALIAWTDCHDEGLRLQHVLADGALAPAWPVGGLALCTTGNWQIKPVMVGDGAGGAIVAWQDQRAGEFSYYHIYAQHVLASGVVDPAWPSNCLSLCTVEGLLQCFPAIVSDGAGGAIVTWQDGLVACCPYTVQWDVYAQHILASGELDSEWPGRGLAVCTAVGWQDSAKIVADGAGGAIIAWHDMRSGGFDIYAQHVLASGIVDPSWPVDGRAVCTAPYDQRYQCLVSDGSNGAIVAWEDYRTGANSDVYAQRVLANGTLDPEWPTDGRAVCTAAYDQVTPVILGDGVGGAIVAWTDGRRAPDAIDLNAPVYAQQVDRHGQLGGPVTGSVREDAPLAFSLDPIRPNPSGGGTLEVHCTLTCAAPARLELVDVAGRQIAAREVGTLGPGRHTLNLAQGRHLAPGLYLVRLTQGSSTRTTRVAVLR